MMDTLCAECEKSSATTLTARNGTSICPDCAASYYLNCAACGILLPQDEARLRDDKSFCLDCFDKPAGSAAAAALPDESGIEALIAEYVQLHAEEKRIGERLDEIKEALKTIAAAKDRVAGAVVLRAGEAAVRCSYKVTVKYNQEKIAALENLLNAEEFASLFERKVNYAPVKAKVEEILNSTDDAQAALRDAISEAAERSETASLTVVMPPKKK